MEIKVGYHKNIDLRESFPISPRYAFRKNLGWFAAFFVLLSAVAYIQSSQLFPSLNLDGIWRVQILIAVILGLKFLHAELYRRTFSYGMDGFRMVISRGILLKQKGSLPLLPVTEIYVNRSFIDMMCGLSNLDVYTPIGATRQFARIECLTMQDAERLQTVLGEILTTQVFVAPESNDESAARLAERRRLSTETTIERSPQRVRMAERSGLDGVEMPAFSREKARSLLQ